MLHHRSEMAVRVNVSGLPSSFVSRFEAIPFVHIMHTALGNLGEKKIVQTGGLIPVVVQ